MLHNAETGTMTFHGSHSESPVTLDKVLQFKYLGIPLSVSPYGLFKAFNEKVKLKAQNYLHNVLSLVRTGPDRSELAYTLWVSCALPAILYGCEIIPLLQSTIHEVESCQALVGKFILQIPRNSANVCSSLDAGLQPVWSIIAQKTLLYAHNIMRRNPSYWPKKAMGENLALGNKSPYLKYLLKWKRATSSFSLCRHRIKASVHRAAVISVLENQQTSCVSTFAMNGPGHSVKDRWFKPKSWINDSCFSKIFAEFRSGNSGLGNRGPTKDGRFFKLCPLCQSEGMLALNNEVSLNILKTHNNYTLLRFTFSLIVPKWIFIEAPADLAHLLTPTEACTRTCPPSKYLLYT